MVQELYIVLLRSEKLCEKTKALCSELTLFAVRKRRSRGGLLTAVRSRFDELAVRKCLAEFFSTFLGIPAQMSSRVRNCRKGLNLQLVLHT